MLRHVVMSLARMHTVAVLLFAGLVAGSSIAAEPAQSGGPKTSADVVQAKAVASKADAEGRQVVTLDLDIQKPWHLHANSGASRNFPGLPTVVTVTSKSKIEDVKVEYPTGKLVHDSTFGDHYVYEDHAAIKVHLRWTGGAPAALDVAIQVQACDEKRCLQPATIKLNVP